MKGAEKTTGKKKGEGSTVCVCRCGHMCRITTSQVLSHANLLGLENGDPSVITLQVRTGDTDVQ